jgi:uncharacterized protein
VLKIASRCNLDCDYCYMYSLADTSWLVQPRFISPSIYLTLAARLGTYLRSHSVPRFRVILHGGEPLLAGPARILDIVSAFKAEAPPGTTLTFSMQTNATLLTEDMLTTLAPAGIRFGVSLDGNDAQNSHRPFKSGSSSTSQVLDALALLRSPRWTSSYGGLLAVVNLDSDPVETYRFLRSQSPPMLDLLPRLKTWDRPPAAGTSDWLENIFDAWYLDPGAPQIRLFRIIISRLLGRDVRAGFIGPPPRSRSLAVNADGSAELLDALRSTADGGSATGLSVRTSTLDQIALHPGYTPPAPSAVCQTCPVFDVCGGGYYPNRYMTTENGVGSFDNPSVYCRDLYHLINHIKTRLQEAGVTLPSLP